MRLNYVKTDPWKIIEDSFNPNQVEASESIFSLGNGAMGHRANFEEQYSGKTFQGSYAAGVYYPDKTKVGWWKNGYPKYFAKVINAPNWIGIDVYCNKAVVDLNTATIHDFRRTLDMQSGLYNRTVTLTTSKGIKLTINSSRFLTLFQEELGCIKYSVKLHEHEAQIKICPYIDSSIKNKDSNWNDQFWEYMGQGSDDNFAILHNKTSKSEFDLCTYQGVSFYLNSEPSRAYSCKEIEGRIAFEMEVNLAPHEEVVVEKMGGYCTSLQQPQKKHQNHVKKIVQVALQKGFDALLDLQKKQWNKIWEMADISIEGDIKAQQGIRFNIFQLNQTYTGKNPLLNIGPKGFTGEKYGGSTYWDTEAYCFPFYMATKNELVAENLLNYRYNHLEKAIENAAKLGFTDGAALYPMVTMNGEECHNEWEITFEEIHRNAAIAFAIYNYERYTGKTVYFETKGIDVLVGIVRFWTQRMNFSVQKNQYVILGVTGPNEYENNIDNNWYTNYAAKWCLEYVCIRLAQILKEKPNVHKAIYDRLGLSKSEVLDWKEKSIGIYLPYDSRHGVFLQQDGFLDKDLKKALLIPSKQRPLNQHWSWDRILRSPYIKQADVLQGFYFFEDHFSSDQLKNNFDFYEPYTVHESSLSPSIHAVLAASLGRVEQAYNFYLQTSRLDLDDYNAEVDEGLHITSMAGTWISIVEGFGGMRIKNDAIYFSPQLPKAWDSFSFKINFRNSVIELSVSKKSSSLRLIEGIPVSVFLNKKQVILNTEPSIKHP
jgi:maltose phosphorylase